MTLVAGSTIPLVDCADGKNPVTLYDYDPFQHRAVEHPTT